ncbi:MAG: ribbon-helix-helix domain-containing protein [Flavobacterium sp.]
MTTFTSTLPEDLFKKLNEAAKKLSLPKNKIIEKSLTIYLDQINKAEYLTSYKKMSQDKDVLLIAEEGMEEYFNQLLED